MDALTAPDGEPPERRRLAALACALLGHRPDAPPVWNHGHGFAFCTRCARPIVRTIVHGWRLPPRGYQIRWPDRELPSPRERPPVAPQPTLATVRKGADFMGDPLAGKTSSAFDFDDFATGSRSGSMTDPPRRLAP